jgi:ribosomal protein S27AE
MSKKCTRCGDEMPFDDDSTIEICESCGREEMLAQHEQVPGVRRKRGV